MGFSDTFKKLVGIEEMEDDFDDDEIQVEKERISKENSRRSVTEYRSPKTSASSDTPKTVPIERRVSVAGTSAFKLVVIEPKSFDECPKLVDSLKGRRPVIINLEKIETDAAKKIFDFLSGATYALNGNVQKVANNIFIFAPESVDIAANQDERGFDFGGNKNPWK
ncbi:MAG: cell division protein SepF [Firmicutes bacterium]|jgi:cell division inhibitor SepF|nr:cell division protein SepF [Bacillota bacterium]